jgi:hypothetical protein
MKFLSVVKSYDLNESLVGTMRQFESLYRLTGSPARGLRIVTLNHGSLMLTQASVHQFVNACDGCASGSQDEGKDLDFHMVVQIQMRDKPSRNSILAFHQDATALLGEILEKASKHYVSFCEPTAHADLQETAHA